MSIDFGLLFRLIVLVLDKGDEYGRKQFAT